MRSVGGSYSGRSHAPLVPGERRLFYCQVCDHEADVLGRTADHCNLGSFSPRCPGEKECLQLVAEELDCQPYQLLDPRKVLACLTPWLLAAEGRARPTGDPKPPSIGKVGGWHSRLLATPKPLQYLTERRALDDSILRRFCVGWDGHNLTFPAWEDGRPSYLYLRRPVEEAHVFAMGGPRRQPYPDLPSEGALVLVAGEIDALSGRQLGLRATTISGCSLPDHALPRFAGRCVYVMFDVGEEDAAERVATKLRAVGCLVWVARLERLGLGEGGDLNDYLCSGGSVEEIAGLLRGCRRAA